MIKATLISLLAVVALTSCVAQNGRTAATTPHITVAPAATPASFHAVGFIAVPVDVSSTGTKAGDQSWCRAGVGYSDIAEGQSVELDDGGSGETIGVAYLEPGTLSAGPVDACIFGFSTNISSDSSLFDVRFGDDSRKDVPTSRAELTTGLIIKLGV